MKIKIWPDDTTVVEMDDWLAELRDDGRAVPRAADGGESGPDRADPAGGAAPAVPSAVLAAPVPSAVLAAPVPSAVLAAPVAPAPELAAPVAPAPEPAAPASTAPEPAAPASTDAEPATTVRALIGDQLRMPISWCEMGSCISCHADHAALGEGDQRARAIEAGWRIDAFGRLACPRCQQTDPGFRATHPVVPWDRYTAMARAARIAGRPAGSR